MCTLMCLVMDFEDDGYDDDYDSTSSSTSRSTLVNKRNVKAPVWKFYGLEADEKGNVRNLDIAVCKILIIATLE